MRIHLVHCPIVYITRRHRTCMFLFTLYLALISLSGTPTGSSQWNLLPNEMLRTCLHATLLQSQYCLVCTFTSEIWIRPKAFPIPSTLCAVSAAYFYNPVRLANLCNPAKIHHRPQHHIHSFCAMFKAHEKTTLAY